MEEKKTIIEKLGIKPIRKVLGESIKPSEAYDYVGVNDMDLNNLEQQKNELLEALSNIIKIQNDPRESLSNLNRSIHNAEFLLIAKFPEIKELLLCTD